MNHSLLFKKSLMLLFSLALYALFSVTYGQVNQLGFSTSNDVYTEITGGSVLGTSTSDEQYFVNPAAPTGGTSPTGVGIPIGFSFVFNGNTFDCFGVQNNGWISLGKTSLGSTAVNMTSGSASSPLNSTSTITPSELRTRIAALTRDLQGQTGSELSYKTIGTAPNRTLVVQFKNYRKYGAAGDTLNFQIRLNETTNSVQVVYGKVVSNSTSSTCQVGIGGSTSTDFRNVTNGADWTTSITTGTLNTSTCTLVNTNYPASGLTFTWQSVPMAYTSSNTTQNTSVAFQGTTNTQVIGIQIVTFGTLTPVNLNSFSVNASGTTNISDISNAKIYYTGNIPAFSLINGTLFGTATPSLSDFAITGSQDLKPGTNYFWLTFDVAPGATVGNTIDAVCNSFDINDVTYNPATTSPVGSRTIASAPYFVESFEGTWSGSPAAPSGWTQSAVTTPSGGLAINWAQSVYNGSWSPAPYSSSQYPAGAYDGAAVAWFRDGDAITNRTMRLATGNVNLSASTNPRIRFAYSFYSGSGTLRVRASSDDGATWNDISGAIASTGTSAWTQVGFAIPSAYKVANARFAFDFSADYGSYDTWLDYVVIDEIGTTSSTVTGGNWNSASSWSSNVVPPPAENIIIKDGATVTIDGNVFPTNLQVGEGTSGILQYDATSTRSLTVSGNLTISSGGTFNAFNGTTGRTVILKGDLVNNGTADFSKTSTLLNFLGSAAQNISGSGTYTNGVIRQIALQNLAGLTLNSPVTLSAGLNLVQGTLTNGGNLTFDNTLGGVSTSSFSLQRAQQSSLSNYPTVGLTATYNVTYYNPLGLVSTNITGGYEIPVSNTINALTINNSAGVTLNNSLNLSGTGTPLTLTSGILTMGSGSVLTVTNIAANFPAPAASATSWVNGKCAVTVNSATDISRNFPVGGNLSGQSRTFALNLFNNGGAGTSTITVTCIQPGTTNSAGTGLTQMSNARRFLAQVSGSPLVTSATTVVVINYSTDDNLNMNPVGDRRMGYSSLLSDGPFSSVRNAANASATSITSDQLINPSLGYYALGISTGSLPKQWIAGSAGNWSNAGNWDLGVPTSTDNVYIQPGTGAVTLDVDAVVNSVNLSGTLNISTNSLQVGAGTSGGNKNFTINGGATLNLSGSQLFINGNFALNSNGALNWSAGNIIVDGNDGTSAGSLGSGVELFAIGNSSTLFTGTLNVTGGTLTIVDPPYTGAAMSFGYHAASGYNKTFTNNTLIFGDGVSNSFSTSTVGFGFDTYFSNGRVSLGNVIVNGGSGPARFVTTSTSSANGSDIGGNLTINANCELRDNQKGLVVGGNLVNNGVLITSVTNPLAFAIPSGTTVAASPNVQVVSGTGLFRNSKMTVTVASGGTGYTVGDVLTISDGTFTTPATLEVTAVSSGVITTAVVNSHGIYSVAPVNPVSVTGGTGTGATFNLTGLMPAASFANVTINNSNPAGVTFSSFGTVPSTVTGTVSGTLTLTKGMLNVASNVLTLGTTTASLGTLTFTNAATGGFVKGKFKRWVGTSTSNNTNFPVGADSIQRNALINFTAVTTAGGTLTTEWVAAAPGTNGLPLTEGSINVNQTAPEGFWRVTPGDGFNLGTGLFTATFNANVIGGVNDSSSLVEVRRDDSSSPWTLTGTHVNSTGTKSAVVLSRTSVTSFGEFAIAGDIVNNPLPVELSQFIAASRDRSVTLNWMTETEHNSQSFVVERESSGKWISVGTVKAAGNTNIKHEYSYTENKLNSGRHAYRLKMIDNNGAVSYSKEVESVIDLPKTYALSQNYPNPFNPSTRIDYQLPFDAKVNIELYSITGERVGELVNTEQSAGYYTLDISSYTLHKNLASGVYIYRMIASDKVNNSNFVNVKKMVLLK